jgi:uncharacterized protein YraI
MQLRNTLLAAVAVTVVTVPGAFSAEIAATAVTALNIRSGPGPQYPIIGYIPQNTPAVLVGCIPQSLWCSVNFNGKPGWADSEYLTVQMSGRSVVLSQANVQMPAITYEVPATVGAAPAPAPVISGTFVQRSATGAPVVITPPPTVRQYVVANPTREVYLNGEVVEGAGLPPDVALTPVPDYQYQYAYVNGVPVLVEPQSRRVTYVYR